MTRFQNKVCIVTGAASGIGRATAERLASEGGRVCLVDRNKEKGEVVAAGIANSGGQALFLAADVAEAKEVRATVQAIVEQCSRIDILVNNAAMMTFKPLLEVEDEMWDKVMAVNLKSTFLFCKYSLPYMNGGSIVNVSSVHAHETTANVVPYATSKGGIEAFTRGLSRECTLAKARINCVDPGAIDTPMLWSNPNVQSGVEQIDSSKIGQPEDIAAAICFLASDEARFITGASLVVDGGRLGIL